MQQGIETCCQFSAVQWGAVVKCNTVQCKTNQYSALQYRSVQYMAVQSNYVHWSAVQRSEVQCRCSAVQLTKWLDAELWLNLYLRLPSSNNVGMGGFNDIGGRGWFVLWSSSTVTNLFEYIPNYTGSCWRENLSGLYLALNWKCRISAGLTFSVRSLPGVNNLLRKQIIYKVLYRYRYKFVFAAFR